MTAPPFEQERLPLFKAIHPDQIEPHIRALLDHNRQTLKTLLSQPGSYTWNNLLEPIERMSDELSQFWSPISHLRAVMESKALRQAYNKVLPLLTHYHTELSQNEDLFKALVYIADSPEFSTLSPAQRKLIENDIRDFKLAGIHLPLVKKTRLAELQTELSQLTTTFSENVLDATQAFILHVTDLKQLEGLPQKALELAMNRAKERGLTGYVLTLDYPSYSAAIKFLRQRDLRKTLYDAFVTRASDRGPNAGHWDNTLIMEKILRIRHEIAQLVGFNNYAEYSLATKMAKTPDEVMRFLNDLLMRSKPIAEEEFKTLTQFAQTIDGISTLEAWDISYYSEKLQESTFRFSQEDCRPYFPITHVLKGLFTLVNRLYGLSIREEKEIEVWHPDVTFFSIDDEKNELRGGFYVDLYARTHKREGAWMDECHARRQLSGETLQHPVAFLTCNFMPSVNGQPALLTHDDVLTLFHEFGHCLHHVLTQVDYPSLGGISGVPWDAVEFPSQLMENYCWEKESLSLIAAHYQTGAALPDELFQKMLAAKYFQTGLQMVRQLEFSLFDFCLHENYDPSKSDQVQSVLNDVRQWASVIPAPEFNRFQHSFSHIFAGGYAAGYYSYKWSEILSADAYALFEEKGLLDRTTGESFMKNILEVGGTRDPLLSFIAFRGRKPTIDALLKQNGMLKS